MRKTDRHTVTDLQLQVVYSKWNFGERQNDHEWRRKHTACQLLKVMEGFNVSHSQRDVLNSLKLLNKNNQPTRRGRRFIFDAYYEQKYS